MTVYSLAICAGLFGVVAGVVVELAVVGSLVVGVGFVRHAIDVVVRFAGR